VSPGAVGVVTMIEMPPYFFVKKLTTLFNHRPQQVMTFSVIVNTPTLSPPSK